MARRLDFGERVTSVSSSHGFMLFRRILVPVDFSASSKRALEIASSIAEQAQGCIDVLHVWQPAAYAGPADLVQAPIAPTFDADMNELTSDLRDREIEFHTRTIPGDPITTILETAPHYDLVVIGTHRHHNLWHALVGGVAERVSRRAPCCVLTVPVDEQHHASSSA